jgi:threonine dehydrogenase-like Zn-dependent dehydrogenase
MRAIVLAGPGRVEVAEDWPEPVPGPQEVVVRMRGVGLCGSDLEVYHGRRETPGLPWPMGHEGGGDIVTLGAGVTDRRIGQRVAIEPNYCCLSCPQCRSGNSSRCPRRTMVGFNHPGLLAERVAVPARFTWPVPADWPDATLACVEPVAVARSAVRRSRIEAGDRCLVVGAGSQGLFLCQALRAVGVWPVIVEPHPGRLALAQRLGATPAGDDTGEGFRFVFEASGVADGVRTALDRAAPGGTVILVGLSPTPLPLTAAELVRRQLSLRGSLIYDHPADFPDTIAAIARRELDPGRVVQPGFPPERAGEAFAGALKVPGKPWLDLSPWRCRIRRTPFVE